MTDEKVMLARRCTREKTIDWYSSSTQQKVTNSTEKNKYNSFWGRQKGHNISQNILFAHRQTDKNFNEETSKVESPTSTIPCIRRNSSHPHRRPPARISCQRHSYILCFRGLFLKFPFPFSRVWTPIMSYFLMWAYILNFTLQQRIWTISTWLTVV